VQRDRLEEIWGRYLAGQPVGADDQREAAAALDQDADLRRELLADARLHGLLGAMAASDDASAFLKEVQDRLAADADRHRFAATVDRSLSARRRTRRLAVAAALLLPAAAALVLWLRRPVPPANDAAPAQLAPPRLVEGQAPVRLERVDGSVYLIESGRRVTARAGNALGPDRGLVSVGRDSGARIRLDDGTDLDLRGDALVAGFAADGEGLFLAAGTLRAQVARRPPGRPFTVDTPHATAVVLGTRFTLSVSGGATQLRVLDGRVRFERRQGGQPVMVGPGEQATTAAAEALVLAPDAGIAGGLAVLVVGTAVLLPGDDLLVKRLEKLGLEVQVRSTGALSAADLVHSTLLVISPTIQSSAAKLPLRDATVPILVSDAALFDDLGMTDPLTEGGGGTAHDESGELVIRHASHPLAAGFTGSVRVTSASANLWWGTPGPFAAWVATLRGSQSRAAIFGYERGALMPGGTAPARRVGFFIYDNTPALLTDAGWALFDAAVRWCAEGSIRGDHP
jgi:ferric-dicitrate binding protein FerR (iron transport regulator)